jgi:hypothetical protein
MEKWKALVNHTIELLDGSHGQEVKDFYQSIGVYVYGSSFNRHKADCDERRFYMVTIDGNYDFWSESESRERKLKIVTLEEAKRIVNGGSSIIPTTESSINISTTKIIGRIIC